jgi:hypothetical protein
MFRSSARYVACLSGVQAENDCRGFLAVMDPMSAKGSILLQKSKVAAVQIFGENLKRKEVNDSHSLSRATEVAHEFGAGR